MKRKFQAVESEEEREKLESSVAIVRQQPSRPNENTYWVTENLIAGEYPGAYEEKETRDKIKEYLNLGINYFVDLTKENEKDPYKHILMEEATKAKIKVRHRRLSIEDFGIPSKELMATILDTIDEAVAEKKKVYVHCRGGIGRTGTTVGCYLARHGYSGDDALVEVNRLFQNSERSFESSSSPETGAQKEMVRGWKKKN